MTENYLLPNPLFPVTLEGKSITIRPMKISSDIPILYLLTNGSRIIADSITIEPYDPDQTIWKFMFWSKFNSVEDMIHFYRSNLSLGYFFTIFDNQTNSPIGSIGYGNIFPEYLNLEIIRVWISPVAQGRGKCTEAVNLMVDHAFRMGYKTLYWRTSVLNEKSRKIAERVGFKMEIIASEHYIKTEYAYDVIFYSQHRLI